MTKKNMTNENEMNYGFYSRVLQKPFDSLSELKAAEEAYANELKAKEDKAAQKKADAQKVEDAFKALNAARKAYKEDLTQLTKEYAEELENLKKAYELGKKDITTKLAEAEDTWSKAVKEFTATHGNFHMTLKDGDIETTISGSSNVSSEAKKPTTTGLFDLFDWVFGF